MVDPPPPPRSRWPWIVSAAVVGTAATALTTWFIVDSGSANHNAAPQDPSSTGPTATQLPPEYVADACDEPVEYRPDTEIEVADQTVEISEGELTWEARLQHDSDLVAMDVPVTIALEVDGEDITNDMAAEFTHDWINPELSVSPDGQKVIGEENAETPEDWESSEVTLDVTVSDPNRWCTPRQL